MTDISPLAPTAWPELPPIRGVEFATAAAGIKYQGRDDVMLAKLAAGSAVAGVFTKSATRAAPVLDCQAKIGMSSEAGAAFLVNSGNANAFTGKSGAEAVKQLCAAVAERCDVPLNRVFTASTGVIGEPLPYQKVLSKLDHLFASLDAGGAAAASSAILTTDTFPKYATAQCDGITLVGMVKGSGMIAPDMATMLGYIFTDARVPQDRLQQMTERAAAKTFNCITVDSDTSTSDTVLVAATGASGVNGEDAFEAALTDLMMDLAHLVVRDGEGASKFVTINATGARDDADAKRVAMAVANSPLVKTALAGEDPNWGRIVMAVGKSGAEADRDRLSIWFGDVLVAENGWVSPTYQEVDGQRCFQQREVDIRLDLGIGAGQATVWTCDLTHGYISINADYRS